MKKCPKNGEKCQNLAIFDVAQKKKPLNQIQL